MNGLTIVFGLSLVFALAFLLWMKTPSGKKCLNMML